MLNFIETSSRAVSSYTGFSTAAFIPGLPDTTTSNVTVCPLSAVTVDTVIVGSSAADIPNAHSVISIAAATKTEKIFFISFASISFVFS